MPFPKITDASQILVNGRQPSSLVKVVKPAKTDRGWSETKREAMNAAIKRGPS